MLQMQPGKLPFCLRAKKTVVIILSSFSAWSALLAKLSDKMDICFLRTLGDGGLCLRGRAVQRRRCHLSVTACVCSSVSCVGAVKSASTCCLFILFTKPRRRPRRTPRAPCHFVCREEKAAEVGGKKIRGDIKFTVHWYRVFTQKCHRRVN